MFSQTVYVMNKPMISILIHVTILFVFDFKVTVSRVVIYFVQCVTIQEIYAIKFQNTFY